MLAYVLVWASATAYAGGLEWLTTQQDFDGSYGQSPTSLATPLQTTAEVIRAQAALGQGAGAGFEAALAYLNAHVDADTELLARAIVVNAEVGYTAPELLPQLLSHRGEQGAFGARPGYDVSVYDTAFALEALAAAGDLTSPQAAAAVGFLLSRQQGSGGWADGPNAPSVFLTAQAMQALWPYRSTFQGVASALTNAQGFLVSRRSADGLWGEDFTSALAVLALAQSASDLSVVEASATALQARQLSDGSWSADAYSTALALRALRAYDARKSGSTPAPSGTLTGYVVAANSTEPIAGATVTVAQIPGIEVLTNAEGSYVIPGLPAGSYTVTASKAGYTSSSTVAGAEGNQVTLVGKLVLDVVSQTGLVRGKVFDALTQQPLSAVVVSLQGAQGYSALTDGAGAFDFGPVEPGDYSLRFEKAGYLTLSGTVTVVAGRTVSAQLGMTLAGGWVDDTPGTVSGRVVDGKTGQPLVGAVVDLGSGLAGTSGMDGIFAIASVPRGSYQGTLAATGYQSVAFSVVFSPGSTGDMGTLPLYPVDPATPPTSLVLRGLVVDGVSGAPIPGTAVSLTESGVSTTAGTDGRFVLSDITLQSFHVALSAAGYAAATYALQVSAYGEVEVTFKLSPPGTGATSSLIAGRVTDTQTGAAVAGAQVAIAGTSLSALTDADGHYSLSGIQTLEFTIAVSAVGYVQQSLGVKLAAHGSYALDAVLEPVAGDSFQVVALSAQAAEYGANTLALFTARVASLLTTPRTALVLGEIQDGSGISVATVVPYAEGTTVPTASFTFGAGEVKTLTVPWNTAQVAPGTYRLVLRVVEPGTISRGSPFGEVLAENASHTAVVPTLAITGGLDINPPITQAGLPTEVSLAALVQNAGNTELPAGTYLLTVSHPDTGATLYSTEVEGGALPVGATTTLSFGTWQPKDAGNLEVRVRPAADAVAGVLDGVLYVGDKASGTFTVSRTVVPEGTQTVRGTVQMQGVDTTKGGSVDPLYVLVKDAVQRGGAYTAPAAIAWHQSNRCLGCHIQTQSLLGLSSSFDKADIDRKATQFLFNAISSSQRADGGLRISHDGYTKTQTTLGLWSLSQWRRTPALVRTKLRAAQHLQNRKVRSGDQTYWTPDHASGWWSSNVSHTALTVKGYADVLEDAAQLEVGALKDASLGAALPLGTGTGPRDAELGSDGALYVVKNSGVLSRVDLASGSVTVAASGLPSSRYGLAIAPDGTMYVSGSTQPTLVQIRPDGTRTSISVPGTLLDVAIGPDGWLYVSDLYGRRILRRSPTGVLETFVSGGLLNYPRGLAFDAEGNLLVANQYGYNILKVAPDRTVSIHADGLAYQPDRLALAADGSLYVTTMSVSGLLRISPEGDAERVVETSSDLGVALVGERVLVTEYGSNALREVESMPFDPQTLTALRDEVPRAARYLLSSYRDNSGDNTLHALRLIGLAEARAVVGDAVLAAEIDTAVAFEAELLRKRQRADGGWGQYSAAYYPSAPLPTAMVGLALEYTQPSPDDPQIRRAIEHLLRVQRADGSWGSEYSGLGTRLASTSFVMVFMPKALERLGGIDIDLRVDLPSSVQLTNPSLTPTETQPSADNGTQYLWRLTGVTGAGRRVDFDLTLADMALHEERAVARSASMEFDNSFIAEKLHVPLDVPVVRVESGMTLAVATDKGQYQADEQVRIHSTVANTGPTVTSGQVVLTIRPSGSTEALAVLPALPVTNLAAGAQLPLEAEWNTGSILTGDFEVLGTLLDARGRVVAESVAPFAIVAPVAVASTSVGTDKQVYDAWDEVHITGRVRNTATNALLAPSRAELTVKGPAGETLSYEVRNLNQLVPGGLVTLSSSLLLADAASGTYQVSLVLKDAFTRTVLSTSSTTFQVVRRAVQSLTGSASVELAVIHQGDPNACADDTQNVSSLAVPGVKLSHLLVSMDSGEVLDTASELVNLAGDAEHTYTRAIATADLALGGYACVLQAEVDGEVRTLASVGFRVVEPPIKVSATMALAGRGRLLVLLDDAALEADPNGPEVAPELAAQRAFLETLLSQAGWSYTLTESAEDFTRELRTGGYVAYALFSEQEKLSEQAQKELREAVFRGEGLLVAGAHDSRNHGQAEPLGVKYIGHLSDVSDVVLEASAFPLLSGDIQVLQAEHPERVERTGAEALGAYRQSGKVLGDAVTLHTYGRAEAAFCGADLLAIATRDGQGSTAAGVLRALLERVHPAQWALRPGSVVPMELTVTNQGIAVPVSVSVSLPAGSTVVDPGAGVVSGQALTFAFPLAEDEVRTVRFWVRLPEQAGAVTLQATVTAGEGSHTVSVAAEVGLSVVAAEALPDIREALGALIRDGHPDSKVLSQAGNFLAKAAGDKDQATAIRDVLQATDVLVGLSEPRVVALRVRLGGWLRWASLQAN